MKRDTLLSLVLWGTVTLLGMTVQANSASAATWVKCADENGTCAIKAASSVRYGTGTSWITKIFSSSITCNNSTFGSDPAPGKVKECDLDLAVSASPSPSPSPTPIQTDVSWVKCAAENGTCSIKSLSNVRYGTGTSWVIKRFDTSITCNTATFGSDPAQGKVKECDIAVVVSPSPTPSPSPTVKPSPSPTVTVTPSPSPSQTIVDWSKCAVENGTCAIKSASTVRYGTGTTWITKTFSSSITCNTATFGSDPAAGKVKECDIAVMGNPLPSPSPSPTVTASPTPTPTSSGAVLTSSLTTSAATSFCSTKAYPKQWDWASGYVQSARAAVPSDGLTPRIEQHRVINGVDTVVAVYRSFSSSSSCTEIWLPATNTTGYTPAQLQTMANTGCGPFGNTPHIDLFRLWKNGDTFLVYPAVYTGLNNNIVIQPQHDIYISGQAVPTYTPDHITIRGVEQNGIRPVLYRNDKGPGDFATNMGPIYLMSSTNLTISNLDVALGPNGLIYKGLVYVNGAGYGGTDANGKLITGTTTLRNMRISGGRIIPGGVNGIFSTGSVAGTLALENIELFDNGGNNGPAHNAYLGSSSVDPNFTVKLTGSWTHDAVYGHTFKTRAQRNIITGNYFQGGVPQDGFTQAEAYLLDVPNGGVLVAKNNIFAKAASGGGSNGMSISYAAEGIVDTRPLAIDIENNTFVTFAATFDGLHPSYPMYFRGGVPGDTGFLAPNSLVSKNLFVGYCPLGNARMDYKGDLSLTVGFSELKQDFTLLNRYNSADQSIVGTQAYKHVTQPGLLRKLPTIGAED